ncbi:hypothetical protein LCM17_18650 [Cereibacter sphaeroides]|nr:hypothetical protein [Cereibacter sphaeroides]
MAGKFEADLSRFADLTIDKAMRVVKQSAQETFNDAQTPVAQGGSMPVDGSFLRNSAVSDLNGSEVAQGPDAALLTIIQMDPGDLLRFGWTAPYARHRHYKPEDYGQGGGHWRDKAAAKWQQRVTDNAQKVR